MIIPYKVKNPPRHFPYTTVALIAANALVYAFTTDQLLAIRPEVVDSYATRWGESPFFTVFTAMFLHAGPLHLIQNMLCLWIFGPAVEDRLRPTLFLGMYLLAGFAGSAAHAALSCSGAIDPTPSVGASGCVMGVLGAYWYLYSWSPVCIFYWFYFSLVGTFEVAAFWIIGSYFVLDLLNGLLARHYGVMGGVANFAHVGGALAGLALVWAFNFRRDSSELSQAKANQAELGGTELLECGDLSKLVQDSPEAEELLLSYVQRAWERADAEHLDAALRMNPRAIVTSLPEAAADYLLAYGGDPRVLSSGDLLYLARRMDDIRQPHKALQLYEMLTAAYPDSREIEIALYRQAVILLRDHGDPQRAADKLHRLLAAFPNSTCAMEAEDLLRQVTAQSPHQNSRAA